MISIFSVKTLPHNWNMSWPDCLLEILYYFEDCAKVMTIGTLINEKGGRGRRMTNYYFVPKQQED